MFGTLEITSFPLKIIATAKNLSLHPEVGAYRIHYSSPRGIVAPCIPLTSFLPLLLPNLLL